MNPITESHIETFTIETLQSIGWEYVHGLAIAPGAEESERESFEQVVLIERLRKAVSVLNPHIPKEAQERAVQKVLRIYSPDLLFNNETFHQLLIEKVKVPYQKDGYERSHEVALMDFEHVANNEFLAVNQYTIIESGQNKRPDVLLFINGLPVVVMELKNATDEHATMRKAYEQIQVYKATIPSLFTYNAICVISDGHECKAGSLSAGFSRYMSWKSMDGVKDASRFNPQLEVLVKGMLNQATLLDLIRNFIVFEKTRKEVEVSPESGSEGNRKARETLTQVVTEKKLAAYHQYYAVNKAVESTIRATGFSLSLGEGRACLAGRQGEVNREAGSKKAGVVWHTQGSGKSLSMVFYAGKLITAPEMENPTLIVLTDRNDLDDQLFGTFASSMQLLRQEPVQAKSREDLKELLQVASGGIVFTTIQKFFPEVGKTEYALLSERKNIVVIADEAHRTQYGFEAKTKDILDRETKEVIGKRIAYGFAKYMHKDALPNATFIGFTGTPIESTDVNTPQVFGQYVDIYDISQAVNDGATVKIYYESRLATVSLDEKGRKLIEEYDRELEEEEFTEQQKAKARWTKLEAIIGHPKRIKNIAKDIVSHFEEREKVFEGKGMIVAMSRRIAANLYKEIVALRPEWHDDDLARGTLKVIMTAASSDGVEMQRHHTTKGQRRNLSDRMKDEHDSLKMVIVIDMWLTGFDAPSLHTMYLDKPMRGHTLMQAIARVNRVFKDKPGGLVVDYLGIATDLKEALSSYSSAGGKGKPTEDLEKAVELMLEKMEVVEQMFNEETKTRNDILVEEPEAYYENSLLFNYRRFFNADSRDKLSIILQAEEHILGLDDGKDRFVREVTLLSQAFALTIPDEEAMRIKDDVAFFQAVKVRLVKFEGSSPLGRGGGEALDTAIKQIVDQALASDKVIDIFDAAGIKRPDISILSEEFLQEVKGMKHQNLAFELLKRLLNNEIKTRARTNLVKSRALLEMLEGAIKKYQNNLLTTAEIIQELIGLAKDIKAADKEGERLGLTSDEVAFYDALEVNDSAVKVLGDATLREIAKEIADKVRRNATIDWRIRESARAKMMVIVKRTLTKHGYPPDKQAKAIETVLKQAELMADGLVE